jgi:hypothetical protein
VLSPLFPTAELAAEYAEQHMSQTDGRKDRAFWLAQATETAVDPSLTDAEGQRVELSKLKSAVTDLRGDRQTARAIAGVAVPSYLGGLLESNCDWAELSPPAEVVRAAVRLGLEGDDMSPWLDESAAIIRGEAPLRDGASFEDAATVYLWYFDSLVTGQRHDWSMVLGLSAEA